MAGQFCGDFVRGRDLSRFPGGLERGIRLHRYLDRYTDTHPELIKARHSINEVPLRFSGILIDVMFDHYLALRWDSLNVGSLDRHVQRVHSALEKHQQHFPDSLKRFMLALVQEKILQGNIHLRSIETTLNRISRRSTRYSDLSLSIDQLEPLRDTLVNPFDIFFPDLHHAAQMHFSQSGEGMT